MHHRRTRRCLVGRGAWLPRQDGGHATRPQRAATRPDQTDPPSRRWPPRPSPPTTHPSPRPPQRSRHPPVTGLGVLDQTACAPQSLTPGDTRSHRWRTPQPAAAANHARHAPPSTDARPPPATRSAPRPPRQPPLQLSRHHAPLGRPISSPPRLQHSAVAANRRAQAAFSTRAHAPTPPTPDAPPVTTKNDSNINSTIFSQTDHH